MGLTVYNRQENFGRIDTKRPLLRLQNELDPYLRCRFRGCFGNPPLTGYGYMEFLGRSKMGLNFSHNNSVPLYSSDRLTQLVGNGLLTFCPRVPDMETLFAETELVYFDTHEDLIEKIVYFNTHDDERRQIAEKGWHRTHTCYSSEPVTQFMIELLFEVPYSSDYEWKDFVFHRS